MAQTETRPCECGCGELVTETFSRTGRKISRHKHWVVNKEHAHRLRGRSEKTPWWKPNPFRGKETRPCAIHPEILVTRYVTEENHDQPWFHSRTCSLQARNAQPRKRHGDVIPCDKCGQDFYRSPADVRRNRRFHIKQCADEGKKVPRIQWKCANPDCDVVEELVPSRNVKRYHDDACRRRAQFKHGLDRVHNGKPARLNGEGYVLLWEPTHPESVKRRGWVMEHRLLMEQQLGRPLEPGEEVDHINTKRDDNRLENLQLLNRSDHRRKTGQDRRERQLTLHERLALLEKQVEEYRQRFGPLLSDNAT